VAAAAAALVVAFLILQGGSRTPDHVAATTVRPQEEPKGELEITRDNGPLLSGEKVSVAEAVSNVAADSQNTLALLLPNHEAANDASIKNVYYESALDEGGNQTFQLAIDYDSGIVVVMRPAAQDFGFADDPEKQYEEMADGYPNAGFAHVDTVHGVPALVVDENERGGAYVDLVLNGMRIQFYAAYAPVESKVLVQVAETLG
jgi:hypothetical protein